MKQAGQAGMCGSMCITYLRKVSKLLQFIIFADDTNIFYLDDDPISMVNVTNEELDKLTMWFKVNKLSLNITKSNYMVFSKKKLAIYLM